MTDLGNPYQALGKETVRTSYEQSHKETCLKFSPTAWGTDPPPMWGFIPHAVGEIPGIYSCRYNYWGDPSEIARYYSLNPNRSLGRIMYNFNNSLQSFAFYKAPFARF